MSTVLFPVNELRIGGAEQQLLELVRGLDKRRFRPIVAPLFAGGPLDGEFRAVPGLEVVDLHRKGKYDASTLARMARLLRTRRVDIVQPFLTPATFFGLLPALLVRTPIKIVTERCGIRLFRGAGYTAYRVVEDALSRTADAVVANSLAGQELLLSRGISADKIRVFYNGVNPERMAVDRSRAHAFRQQLGTPSDGKVITILASLTPPKDHATFLHAAARVSAQHPEVRYAVVGDGPLRADLEGLASGLGLSERVGFLGYQRRVPDLIAGSDLLVSCSRDNEGCSNSILEAMFLGVPVVATDIGGNCELIEHGVTGYLSPVQASVPLAESIVRRLEDSTGTAAVAAHARQQVLTRFSLDRMVGDYASLYEDLLARRHTYTAEKRVPRPV